MTVETNGQATVTGRYMKAMVDTYHRDMLPYVHMSLSEVFDIVKSLPFRDDPPEEETLMRPLYTMNGMGSGGDCDDKSIALASYCKIVGIPYRFIAVRRWDYPCLHHVFVECYIANRWVHADPTYRFNTLGHEREQYEERVIIAQG